MPTVRLTEDELELLSRPVEGQGGFQDILKLMQSRLQGDQLSVSGTEAERIVRYVEEYGVGGFQERLSPLADRLRTRLDAGAEDQDG